MFGILPKAYKSVNFSFIFMPQEETEPFGFDRKIYCAAETNFIYMYLYNMSRYIIYSYSIYDGITFNLVSIPIHIKNKFTYLAIFFFQNL